MGVETATYISDLVITNPLGTDAKSQGDDHLRLLKSTIKATFPNVTGAVTPTHTELNYVDGVTSAIQTQIDTKGAHAGQAWTGTHNFTGATVTVPTVSPGDADTSAASTAFVDASFGKIAGQTWTGTHSFTGATITVPTQSPSDNSTKAASTAYVDATSFTSALPNQTGNSGKFVTTNGTTASWAVVPLMPDVIIQDQKSSGTAGSNITAGAWSARELNTIVRNNGTIASLASNTVTLPAGTWLLRVRMSAAPQAVGSSGAYVTPITPKLRNTTAGSDIALGENFTIVYDADRTARFGGVGEVSAVVTFAGSTNVQAQMYATSGGGTVVPMAGLASSNGTAEVYCTFEATRVAT